MSEYLDDYEQSQAVKKWFKENGTSLVAGVALGLGGIFGWQQFKDWRGSQQVAAADAFREVMVAVESDDKEAAQALATSVVNDFGSSPYAALTALQQAKTAIENGDTEIAIERLRFAADNGKPEAVASLARLRLARVQVSTSAYDDALATLDAVQGYDASVAELKGDVYAATGRRNEALSSYEQSLAALGGGAGNRQILQMKIDDLNAASTEPESEESS